MFDEGKNHRNPSLAVERKEPSLMWFDYFAKIETYPLMNTTITISGKTYET